MRVILKQFFKTILKKAFLIITFLFSLLILSGTLTIGILALSTVSQSNNGINQKGNASELIFDKNNVPLGINYTSPNLDANYEISFSNNSTLSFNLNGIDVNNDEMIVFPISREDYQRLSMIDPDNLNWQTTAMNNQNLISSNPSEFGHNLIFSSNLTFFSDEAIRGYNLSQKNENGDMDIYLDPRTLIIQENAYNQNDIDITGFYKDYQQQTSFNVKESLMIVSNPLMDFEPKSLLGENTRVFGVHRNINITQHFKPSNDYWINGKNNGTILYSFFKSLPNLVQGDPKPAANSGIPYIENSKAIEIQFNLDMQNISPMTKLYLASLDENEANKIINDYVLMTPFQISEGKFESIPTSISDLEIFRSDMQRFTTNLIKDKQANLSLSVNEFKDNLVIDLIDEYQYTTVEEIILSSDNKNYLFTSKEISEINQIILIEGSQLYYNQEESLIIDKILNQKNLSGGYTFEAFFESIKFFTDFQEIKDGQPIFNAKIWDMNNTIQNPSPIPGSQSASNPSGVLPTELGTRFINDILSDIIIELFAIDNNENLNFLTSKQRSELSKQEQVELIDYRKTVAITNSPIYLEFMAVFYDWFFFINEIESNINKETNFSHDFYYSTISTANGFMTNLNFENYGVIVSSAHFIENNLKVFDNNMVEDAYETISQQLADNPQLSSSEAIFNFLSNINDEYKIRVNDKVFFISGYGNSPDYKAPILNLLSPLPNPISEAIVYVNENQYKYVTSSFSNEVSETINLKVANGYTTRNFLSKLNNDLDDIFSIINEENPFNIYSNTDFIGNPNINTFRGQYTTVLIAVITVIVFAISIMLFVLVTYILTILIKFLFESLGFSIAIARANGIPRRKVVLALSSILIGFGLIASIAAYIASYYLVDFFIFIFEGFWFIPLSQITFSTLGLFGILFGTMLLISIIVWLIAWKFLNKPLLLTLSGNNIVKTNKLAKIIRNNKIPFYAFSKMKISMMSTKIGKISLISALTGLTFGISATSIGLNNKITQAEINNNATKSYAYAFDYQQPTFQTGLIKNITFNSLGEINPSTSTESVIKSSLINNVSSDPYYELLYDANGKVIPNSLLAKRVVIRNTSPDNLTFPITAPISYNNDVNYNHIAGDINSTFKTYENVTLPSLHQYNNFFNLVPTMNFNAVVFAEVLDIDIGSFGGVEIGNLWNQISKFLPSEIITRVIEDIQDYRQLVLKKYPWYQNFLVGIDSSIPVSINNPVKYPLEVNASVAWDAVEFKFTDQYLEALGVFLGDEELIQKNVAIVFNNASNDWNDEPYTYVNGAIVDLEENISIKLMGIKNNSSFINLTNYSNQKINHLIENKDELNVIINQGAAYANGYTIGDKIKVEIKDDHYKDLKNIFSSIDNDIQFTNKIVELTVVGISSDSVGQTYWINQELANNLINIDNGQYIKNLYPESRNGIFVERNDFSPIINYEKNEQFTNAPFNGMFTKDESLKLINNSIPLTSSNGSYGLNFSTEGLNNSGTEEGTYGMLIDLYTLPYNENDEVIKEIYNQVGVSSFFEMQAYMEQNFDDLNFMVNSLTTNIGNDSIITSVIGLDGSLINNQIFGLMEESTSFLSLVVTLVFVPLLTITVMASMLSLSDDFRKSLSILRILGMNKRKTIASVLLIYIPIIIIGASLGLLVSFLINSSLQFIIFSSLSIFVTSAIEWLVYGASFGVMLILVGFIILVTTIIFAKEKFEKSIKF